MIIYHISYDNPLSHFIKVELTYITTKKSSVLKLPSWRPGRYEIQNFAKNLKNVKAGSEEEALKIQKTSKDSWLVEHKPGFITVTYEYYAFKMDAGSSWLDEEQLYLNFINFALYVDGAMEQPHQVELSIPAEYRVATGLKPISEHS